MGVSRGERWGVLETEETAGAGLWRREGSGLRGETLQQAHGEVRLEAHEESRPGYAKLGTLPWEHWGTMEDLSRRKGCCGWCFGKGI